MEKKIIEAVVSGNDEIAQNIYMMTVATSYAASAKPGQFVNIYPKAKHTLLPRPISICMRDERSMTLVYSVVGAGTAEFSGYRSGEAIRISEPLGNGFDLQKAAGDMTAAGTGGGRAGAVLAGGGIGVPPMLLLARELTALGVSCTAVLGFRDEPFLVDLFRAAGAAVHVATDSGRAGYKGTVLDLLKARDINAGHFFACGPRVMLRALSGYCAGIGAPIQVSMEERMGCGYGACVGCVCKIRDGGAPEDGEPKPAGAETSASGHPAGAGKASYRKVCTDGPVFNGRDVVWDE